jgi:prolyl-tRNA synthetase
VEVGPRDVASGKVAVIRRDKLYNEQGKLATDFQTRESEPDWVGFIDWVEPALEAIQAGLYAEAKARLDSNIARNVTDLAAHFKGGEDKFVGWAIGCGRSGRGLFLYG